MNFFSLFKRSLLYKLKKKINIDTNSSLNEKSLDELFHHYGSDKAETVKMTNESGHGFSKFYNENLNQFKDKKIKILEVGSYSGASAAAFKKYFKNSSIYCFDINISKFIYSSEKIHVFGVNINNDEKINKIFKRLNISRNSNLFDVIIDDGSHYLSDILVTFKNLFKYVNNGGIYIIEDFKFPNYYKTNKDIDHILVDTVLESLNRKKLFDSNIIKKDFQVYLQNQIKNIKIYKGKLKDSDICFITRK